MARSSLSGSRWCRLFPGSASIDDLREPFATDVGLFFASLREAGINPIIEQTYRPRQRAYLMYNSFRIAKDGIDPRDVEPEQGVNIDWVHNDSKGRFNRTASIAAAQAMVDCYEIVHRPAFPSKHTSRLAIDVKIPWVFGRHVVTDATGEQVRLLRPEDLYAVGATFGVTKLIGDPPHWYRKRNR